LTENGHVEVPGILFDFGKSEIKPESEPALAVLPQLRWLRNFFEPVLRLPNPADKRAVFCFHHAVAAAGFQHSEKPM
jgi:hypothetical protein